MSLDSDQVQQRLKKFANILELILKVLFLEKWKLRRSKFNGNLYLDTRDFTKVQNFERYFKNMRERGSDPFPEPIIRGHGRATNLYGVKAVASWESRNGYLEALEIEPLISNLS